ncbi:hypothetical protein NCCP1664_16580 [Zafaria cholistanensis]|uniref:HTH tetR-type domain-containing protein n=1 Tax=Zafaria cholistanensis TaxID=1682741 RepID=A0A5A7NSM4_9MICC|nr:TetR/AcrR family transcriptional regulator [Zafaria cholistanensis]GER23162.1 hypothetical protein NCCP1664_16580 [Zafaria cholistanensis]
MTTTTRAERTVAALSKALFDFLAEHDLSELNVSELCRLAGIHRTTFYGHYQGIEEFAAAVYAQTLDRLLDDTFPAGPAIDTLEAFSTVCLEAQIRVQQRILEERPVYRSLFTAGGAGAFRHAVEENAVRRTRVGFGVLRQFGVQEADPDGPGVAFVAAGYAAWVEKWALSESEDAEGWARDMLQYLPVWWPAPGTPQALPGA